METFRIGDKVQIKKEGKGELYSTYKEIFEKLGFKDKVRNYFPRPHQESDVYEVFGVKLHPRFGKNVLAIRKGDVELLIGEDGVKKVVENGEINILLIKNNEISQFEVLLTLNKVSKNFDDFAEYDDILGENSDALSKASFKVGYRKCLTDIISALGETWNYK